MVQDIFLSETAQLADVVLPSAQWAEEEGTMTNLEGRVIRRRQALPREHHPPHLRPAEELAQHGRAAGETHVDLRHAEARLLGGVVDVAGGHQAEAGTERRLFWHEQDPRRRH